MTTKDILKYSIVGILFLTFITNFIVADAMFFPFITGKGFYFRTMIEIAFCLYLILITLDITYLPRRSNILYALCGFMGIMLISTIFSVNPYKSFWSNYERMEGYVSLLHLAAYFLMLVSVGRSKNFWFWFFNISLIITIPLGMLAYSMKFGGDFISATYKGLLDTTQRVDGSFGNSSYLGVYALIHVFLALKYLIKSLEKDKISYIWKRVICYAFLIFWNAELLFHTGTRGAFVGMVVGLFIAAFIIATAKNEKKYLKNIGLAFLIVVIGGVAFLGIFKESSMVKNSNLLARFASLISNPIKVFGDQGYGRSLIWGAALQGVKEKPVFGWGLDSFNYVFNKYYNPKMWGQEQWFDRAHNVFLDWMTAGGVLGLLSYLALYVTVLWYIVKLPHNILSRGEKAMLVGLIASYFVHNIFVFDNLTSYLLFFAIIAYVQMTYEMSLPPRKAVKPITDKAIANTVIIGAVLFTMFTLYYGNFKPYAANASLLEALQRQGYIGSGRPDYTFKDVLDKYKESLSYDTFGASEAREQLASTASGIIRGNYPVDVKQEAYTLVETEYNKQLARTPNDARYYIMRSQFYGTIGAIDKAISDAEKAHELSPGKQAFLYDLASYNISKGQQTNDKSFIKKGEDYLSQAYVSDKTNPSAAEMYAIGLIYGGDFTKLDSLIKEQEIIASSTGVAKIMDSDRVLQSLVATSNYERAISILESKITKNPNNINYLVLLAQSYLGTHQSDKALLYLKQAKALNTDPNSTSQIDSYIKKVESGASTLN